MEITKQFGVEPILLLAQIVNFLIILFVLKKFFYKPIVKMLDERRLRVEESMKNADLIEERLQKTEDKSKEILQSAQNNAEEFLENAKKEAERITQNAIAESQKATQDLMAKTIEQIAAEKQAMKKEIEAETLTLVIDVTQKVLARTVKGKEKQELTKKAISQMAEKIS